MGLLRGPLCLLALFSVCTSSRGRKGGLVGVTFSHRVDNWQPLVPETEQLHNFSTTDLRAWSIVMSGSITTGGGGIRCALTAQYGRSRSADSSGFDKNLVFQAAHPSEEEAYDDSFTDHQHK